MFFKRGQRAEAGYTTRKRKGGRILMESYNVKAFNEKIHKDLEEKVGKKVDEWKHEFQVKRRKFSERSARIGKVNFISMLSMTTIELLLILPLLLQSPCKRCIFLTVP